MKKVLVIDNYDSFTYNLVQLVREQAASAEIKVVRNDEFHLTDVPDYDGVILSPGPGLPSDAGLMPQLVKEYAGKKPILGICLGHQCIAEVFGAELYNLKKVYHGKQTNLKIVQPDNYLFSNLQDKSEVGLYHSWAVVKETLPAELEISASSNEDIIMGIRHQDLDLQGLQFHPESILTPMGATILNNWLSEKR